MNRVEYKFQEIDETPRIISEVYVNEELIASYQLTLPEDLSKVDISILQNYSILLSEKFDEIILNIKNEGLNSDSFERNIAIITNVLRIKTLCDNYVERMDIIE